MAELLIRTQDQDGPVPYRKGDVVYVAETGHKWSDSEKNAVFNKIVKVEGLGASVFAQFTEEKMDGKTIVARRAQSINLDILSKEDLASLSDSKVSADDKLTIIVKCRSAYAD